MATKKGHVSLKIMSSMCFHLLNRRKEASSFLILPLLMQVINHYNFLGTGRNEGDSDQQRCPLDDVPCPAGGVFDLEDGCPTLEDEDAPCSADHEDVPCPASSTDVGKIKRVLASYGGLA